MGGRSEHHIILLLLVALALQTEAVQPLKMFVFLLVLELL